MRFTNILYYMISIDLAIILFSATGIWSSNIDVLSLQELTHIFGDNILGGVGGATLIGASAIVLSKFVPTDKVVIYGIIGTLYIFLTSVTYVIIASVGQYVNSYFDIGKIYLIVVFVAFIIGSIQLVMGGFRSYE